MESSPSINRVKLGEFGRGLSKIDLVYLLEISMGLSQVAQNAKVARFTVLYRQNFTRTCVLRFWEKSLSAKISVKIIFTLE